MESDHTFGRFALLAGSFFLATDNTLKRESFRVDFVNFYRGFGFDSTARNPHSTTQVNVSVESVHWRHIFQRLFISLNKISIVFCIQFTFYISRTEVVEV
jgi:hypothetical protein